MNRKIKFKGQRLTDGKWIEGDFILLDGKAHIYECKNEYGGSGSWGVDPATVGQFTGLLDKTGRDIYEGDIVKWDDNYPPKRIDWFVCQFDAGNGESSMPLLDLKNHFDLEVIGNIHDNPELLNPKQS